MDHFFMSAMCRYFICLLITGFSLLAQGNAILDNAERQLDLLDPQVEDNKGLRDLYRKIVTTYTQVDETQSQIDHFKTNLQTIPKAIDQLKKQLDKEQGKPVVVKLHKIPLAQLELALTQLQST